MLAKEEIERLKETPIEEVAERLGLQVSRHWALCPFHADKHPSLHFNTAKNRYRCYVCGAHGGPIDLAMKLLPFGGRSGGGSFIDACRWIADETNVLLKDTSTRSPTQSNAKVLSIGREHLAQLVADPHLTPEAQHFLFDQRKLDPAVIRQSGISSTKSHLLIPYFDADGKFLTLQWRRLAPPLQGEAGKGLPRFLFPKGTTCSIYNLQILRHLQSKEPLYIAEGCSDCWSMLSAGHKAIAIPSATLLKRSDLEPIYLLLKEGWGGSLHIYPDQDEPGERLYQQLQEYLSPLKGEHGEGLLIRHSLPPNCKDYSEYYMNNIDKKAV